ncbi:glycosyltransferase family 4 protein [Brachybacterium sp. UNK5269]|uniref:glycosyltransferase family 4 protein n=1 Tax=Brachybacterium sp. UNK5269 TaxID=3408576 RepID=UPI003BAF807F
MSTRPRTVLVVHPGAELLRSDRVLLESVTGLREARCRVVVALPAEGPLVAQLRRTGAEVQIVPMLVARRALLRPGAWWLLLRGATAGLIGAWRTLSRVRPDVVYVSTALIPQWPALARLRGIPSISHLHETERSRSRVLEVILYLPHLASRRVLVDSRSSLRSINRVLPGSARRAEIVPPPVASPAHPKPPREPLEGPLRILYIGRLTPARGPDLVIEAAKALLHQGRRADVTLLGAACEENRWFEEQLHEQAADSDVEVEFAGAHENSAIFLAAADVLVVPTRFAAPSGTTLVQGVLALRPVVAGDANGLREAARAYRTTRVVRADDAAEITEALSYLVENWSDIVEQLPASRAEALRRHAPEVYRQQIVRACQVGPAPRSGTA